MAWQYKNKTPPEFVNTNLNKSTDYVRWLLEKYASYVSLDVIAVFVRLLDVLCIWVAFFNKIMINQIKRDAMRIFWKNYEFRLYLHWLIQ